MTDEEWQAYAASGKLQVAQDKMIEHSKIISAEVRAALNAELAGINAKFEMESAKFSAAKRKFAAGSEKLDLASQRFARQTARYNRARHEHPFREDRAWGEVARLSHQFYFDLIEADLNLIGLSQKTPPAFPKSLLHATGS